MENRTCIPALIMTMMMGMERCIACGYEWRSRVESPKECPQCKSRRWSGDAGSSAGMDNQDSSGAAGGTIGKKEAASRKVRRLLHSGRPGVGLHRVIDQYASEVGPAPQFSKVEGGSGSEMAALQSASGIRHAGVGARVDLLPATEIQRGNEPGLGHSSFVDEEPQESLGEKTNSAHGDKVDMQSLRDISAGNIPKAEEAVPVVVPLCPRQGTDERGDRYRCRLPKGHRGQCLPGERIE